MVKITSLPLNTESLFTYLDPRTESKLYLFECEEDLIRALEPFNIETFSFQLVSEISKKFNDDENAPIILQVVYRDKNELQKPDRNQAMIRKQVKIRSTDKDDVYRGVNVSDVYERIKKLAGCTGRGRSHRGPTIEDLFLDIGCSYRPAYFLSKIRNGSSILPKELVKAFAEYFNVSEEYILRGDNSIAPRLKTVHIDQFGGVMKIETE